MNVNTRCNKREGLRMRHGSVKNVSWHMNQKKYVICNVPYSVYKAYSNDKLYNSEVTLKLLLLKDLMEADEIPSTIDFQESIDLALE